MRGAYYITTALLIVASSQTAAEYGQPEQLQTNHHDVMEAGYAGTTTHPQRFLRENGDVHDDSEPTTADDERMDHSKLNELVRYPSIKAIVLDAIREVLGIQTPQTKALEEVGTELHIVPPFSAASSSKTSFRLDWEEWSEVTPEEWNELIKLQKRVDGQSDSTRKRHQHLSIGEGQTKTQRTSFMLNVPPKDIRTDAATERIEFSPEEWVAELNRQRLKLQNELVLRDGVHAAGQPGAPSHHKHLSSNSLQHKAIHDAFIKVSKSSFVRTEGDVALLWSMMGWKGSDSAKIKEAKEPLQIQALNVAAKQMVLSFMLKGYRKLWKTITEPQRFDKLTSMLNERYETLMRVFEIVILKRPDSHAEKVVAKDLLKDFGKSS